MRKKVFEKILKIKDNEQSRKISLFSLMENTIIEIVCNLQEISKEIHEACEFMSGKLGIVNQANKGGQSHKNQHNDVSSKGGYGVYNHWLVLGKISEIK
jgi:hypothetical protein